MPDSPPYADLKCNHGTCERKRHYVLDGRCSNCGWSGYLWITLGHTAGDATGNARCPRCDCRSLQSGEWVD